MKHLPPDVLQAVSKNEAECYEVNLLSTFISADENKVSKESYNKYYWVWSLLFNAHLGNSLFIEITIIGPQQIY